MGMVCYDRDGGPFWTARGPLAQKVSPLVAAIAEAIRQDIHRGTWLRGRPLDANRTLAERYGVSRGVVRAAVEALAEEGTVVTEPNCRPIVAAGARLTERTKTDHISVWLWPSTSDYIASAVFRGLQAGLEGSNYRVVVGTPSRGDDWDQALGDEVRFLESVAEDATCAGALVWPLGEKEIIPALTRCRDLRLPIVFVDREPPPGWAGDVVCTENEGSATEVAEYLRRLGHRRTAILANRDSASSVRDRIAGFKQGMAGAGVSVGIYSPEPGESEIHAYRRALEPLFRVESPPTALFCINDSLALGALEALGSLGIRTPEDVSVVGFDGLLRWLPGGGHLTCAHQNFRRMGELAARLLLRRIAERGDPDVPRRCILLEAPLVVRETTAAPKVDPTAGPKAGQETQSPHGSSPKSVYAD